MKLGQSGCQGMQPMHDLFLEFWDAWPTFRILGLSQLSLDNGSSYKRQILHGNWPRRILTKIKIRSKGSWRGHTTYFQNFGTPLISWERLKLETPNLTRRLTIMGSDNRSAKWIRRC